MMLKKILSSNLHMTNEKKNEARKKEERESIE